MSPNITNDPQQPYTYEPDGPAPGTSDDGNGGDGTDPPPPPPIEPIPLTPLPPGVKPADPIQDTPNWEPPSLPTSTDKDPFAPPGENSLAETTQPDAEAVPADPISDTPNWESPAPPADDPAPDAPNWDDATRPDTELALADPVQDVPVDAPPVPVLTDNSFDSASVAPDIATSIDAAPEVSFDCSADSDL